MLTRRKCKFFFTLCFSFWTRWVRILYCSYTIHGKYIKNKPFPNNFSQWQCNPNVFPFWKFKNLFILFKGVFVGYSCFIKYLFSFRRTYIYRREKIYKVMANTVTIRLWERNTYYYEIIWNFRIIYIKIHKYFQGNTDKPLKKVISE